VVLLLDLVHLKWTIRKIGTAVYGLTSAVAFNLEFVYILSTLRFNLLKSSGKFMYLQV
jgi:hypothetical protein